jgi:hypothetical protein
LSNSPVSSSCSDIYEMASSIWSIIRIARGLGIAVSDLCKGVEL